MSPSFKWFSYPRNADEGNFNVWLHQFWDRLTDPALERIEPNNGPEYTKIEDENLEDDIFHILTKTDSLNHTTSFRVFLKRGPQGTKWAFS